MILSNNCSQMALVYLLDQKLYLHTCSSDPYQHRWSWFQTETVTGLQDILWMSFSGQPVVYCNQAKSFHLVSPGPVSHKIWNIYIPECLCSHNKMKTLNKWPLTEGSCTWMLPAALQGEHRCKPGALAARGLKLWRQQDALLSPCRTSWPVGRGNLRPRTETGGCFCWGMGQGLPRT